MIRVCKTTPLHVPTSNRKYVSVVQDDVDIGAQEIDLLGRDQDLKATGEKRNRDYLADDELDEQLIREIDLIGVGSADRASSSVPELPAPPKLEISKSSKVPTAPEGGSSSSSQLPAGSSLADHFQKVTVLSMMVPPESMTQSYRTDS